MKQIQFSTYGEADVLKVVEVDKPEPQSDELLIEVEAAGVNYSDILRRRNTYFMPTPLPYVLGVEAVGKVIAKGGSKSTSPFNEGDRVLAILPYGGGYAEYVATKAEYCIPLPAQIASKEATALFVQGSTAYLMVNELSPALEGKTILVHAAGGGVGSLLVQLAAHRGAKVIATSSSDDKLSFAQSLGASAGVNYSSPGWVEEVIRLNGGEKVDVVFETIGGSIYAESFSCLKNGGTIIVYGAASGEHGMMHSEHFVNEGITLLGFNLAYYMQHKIEVWQKSMIELLGLLSEDKLKIKTDEAFALVDAHRAHERIEARLTTGKVVLVV